MKKLLFSLIALGACALCTQAANIPDDPATTSASTPSDEGPGFGGPAAGGGMVSQITDDFQNLVTKRAGKFTVNPVFGGMGIGFVAPLDQPDGLGLSMGRSLEFPMLSILGIEVSRGINSLALCFGMTWRNYKTVEGQWVKAAGQMDLLPFPEGTTKCWSRLKTYALNLSLLYSVRAGRHVDFKLGPVLNFITHSSYNTQYRTPDGVKVTLSEGYVYPRTVTVDVLGMVTYDNIGFYCRYAPMKMIKNGCGPQFSSITAGIMFGF